MDSDERGDTKKNRNSMSGDSEFSEPIWVRPFGVQIDTINQGLLDYNAYIICVCGPILYIILHLL
jgi:hypothetical protein